MFSNFISEEVRIIVFGTIKSGKSSTANNILGSKPFETGLSGNGKTKKANRVALTSNNKIVVVDTPGFFDFQDAIHTGIMKEELSDAINLVYPGPHAIILVISVIGFSKTELDLIKWITDEKKDMLKYIYAVFTGRDILEKENKSFEKFKEKLPEPLRKFLHDLKDRVFVLITQKRPTS
ncbi:unnamed protein product [Mytilus edulis]|uniref:AIG1-type G domain-containing protein n=1 Tax=Mytilus edulis TaxID=6550 RepID=A0A8S3SA97_MYTED|nr:unnamed protein product [Mytilus edulis]